MLELDICEDIREIGVPSRQIGKEERAPRWWCIGECYSGVC